MSGVENQEARIREGLADVYTPEGVEHWLTHPHRLLGGECAIDVIQRGEGERVWTLVEQLITGAFT